MDDVTCDTPYLDTFIGNFDDQDYCDYANCSLVGEWLGTEKGIDRAVAEILGVKLNRPLLLRMHVGESDAAIKIIARYLEFRASLIRKAKRKQIIDAVNVVYGTYSIFKNLGHSSSDIKDQPQMKRAISILKKEVRLARQL
jgi:hypothetical protein